MVTLPIEIQIFHQEVRLARLAIENDRVTTRVVSRAALSSTNGSTGAARASIVWLLQFSARGPVNRSVRRSATLCLKEVQNGNKRVKKH
jgi:hypothetical protein